MMRERLLELAAHRTRLVARARAERAALNALLAPADAAAALASSVQQLVRRLAGQAAHYPLVVVAGVALLAVLRPRRAAVWLTRGWSLWRLYRGARGWWLRFSAPESRRQAP